MASGLPSTGGTVRFGVFEADLRSRELRKQGLRIRLQEHPFRLLAILLERPGEVVTREEIQKRLFPEDTFVEFDHSVNTAIQKIRQALGDSASSPRFIETLPRLGYRFVAPVEGISPPSRAKRRWLPWAAGLVAVALIAGAAALHLLPRPRETPLTAVPLTTYQGSELEPSFSPDGEEVSFSWNGEKEDNWDIYIKRIGPGEPRRLTTHPGEDFSPAFSPDGDWVAFHRRLAPEKGAVILVPAPGGPERKIADTYAPPENFLLRSGLTWSPDGKWLVVPDRVSPEQHWPPALFLLSVETGEKRQLRGTAGRYPAFSPDGQTLLFNWDHRGGFALALTEKFEPAAPPKLLTSFWDWTARPAWTQHGRDVIFTMGSALWRIDASGKGAPKRLAHVGEGATFAAVALRGNRLAYTRQTRDHSLWRVEVPFPGGKAGPPVRLITSTRRDLAPEYSPDGRRIAFASDRSGSMRIWVCDSDGSNCRQLTEGWGGSPSWSPDGEQIAFDSIVDGEFDILVVRAEGGAARRLTADDHSHEVVPRWSRDGKWIYFASDRTGKYQVWKMPAGPPPEPENAVQVTKGGGISAFESPDGKFLYYARDAGETSLWRVPVDGGEETRVLDSVQYHSFVVVEEGIYFRKELSHKGPILFFSFAAGEVTEIGAFGDPSGTGFTVSPDGRHILYSQIDHESNDLMLVENFR